MKSEFSWAGVTLGLGRRLVSWLETKHAQATATIGSRTKILSGGRIANISKRKNSVVIGDDCVIAGHIQVFAHSGGIAIGNLVFVGEGSHIWSSADIIIGDRVLISHRVEIHDTESHPFDAEARAEQTRQIFTNGHPKEISGIRAAPIRIGNDVWIGFGATVRKGVTIGEGAIIGAGTIVSHDVEPWTIVAGNPAVVIRKIDRNGKSMSDRSVII